MYTYIYIYIYIYIYKYIYIHIYIYIYIYHISIGIEEKENNYISVDKEEITSIMDKINSSVLELNPSGSYRDEPSMFIKYLY
jgi:hypothetical protein